MDKPRCSGSLPGDKFKAAMVLLSIATLIKNYQAQVNVPHLSPGIYHS